MSPSSDWRRLLADAAYPRLKAYIIAETGLAYYHDRDDDLAAKIAARLHQSSIRDCDGYLRLLRDGETGKEELDELIQQLTIGETFFFRHRELFQALRDVVLPDVLNRNRDTRRLRIWSAGCSIGAEPYTVSILLRRDLASLIDGWDVSILATDINREFLVRASEGRFEKWAFRGTPPDVQQACFHQQGDVWQIRPEFQQGVTFQYHNLVQHSYPSLVHDLFAFDLILCRNVMIYFDQATIQQIAGRFYECLVEGGWLLVGHAEPNIHTYRAFRVVNAPGAILYQRRSGQPLEPPLPSLPTQSAGAGSTLDEIIHWKPPELPPLPASVPTGTERADAIPSSADASVPLGDARSGEDLAQIRRLADQGDLEGSRDLCDRFVQANKLDPAGHFYRALILVQMGDHEEAERALRRAIYLDRSYVLAHYYLGLLLRKQGRAARAARSFDNVLRLLAARDGGQVISAADELTVNDLEELTHMHLSTL